MSNMSHNHQNEEHGTIQSYVIGFILSLIFTAIPYYLVVNKTISGSALVATILGFGVLQMLIQIFFFLHLGRGPKPLYNIVFFVSTVSLILVVVVGSIFIMDHLHYNMVPAKDVTKKLAQKEGIAQVSGKETGACQETRTNHKVTIKGGQVAPVYTEAHLCDTLTFINEDEKEHVMTFGAHDEHIPYGGEEDLSVRKGRNKTITLNQEGTYLFHDHLDPTVTGFFSVAE